jgi:hypothetical protein
LWCAKGAVPFRAKKGNGARAYIAALTLVTSKSNSAIFWQNIFATEITESTERRIFLPLCPLWLKKIFLVPACLVCALLVPACLVYGVGKIKDALAICLLEVRKKATRKEYYLCVIFLPNLIFLIYIA